MSPSQPWTPALSGLRWARQEGLAAEPGGDSALHRGFSAASLTWQSDSREELLVAEILPTSLS